MREREREREIRRVRGDKKGTGEMMMEISFTWVVSQRTSSVSFFNILKIKNKMTEGKVMIKYCKQYNHKKKKEIK